MHPPQSLPDGAEVAVMRLLPGCGVQSTMCRRMGPLTGLDSVCRMPLRAARIPTRLISTWYQIGGQRGNRLFERKCQWMFNRDVARELHECGTGTGLMSCETACAYCW